MQNIVNTKEDGDSPGPILPDPRLVQIHTSEYQALTTRATYFISIMASISPVCVVYLGLAAQAVKSPNMSFTQSVAYLLASRDWVRAAFVWGNFAVLQVMVIVYTDLMLEVYGITLYLETRLKPLLWVGSDFWLYEKFQAQKQKKLSTHGEWVVTAFDACALFGISLALGRFVYADWIGLLVNVGLWAALCLITRKVVETRHEWEEFWRGGDPA